MPLDQFPGSSYNGGGLHRAIACQQQGGKEKKKEDDKDDNKVENNNKDATKILVYVSSTVSKSKMYNSVNSE